MSAARPRPHTLALDLALWGGIPALAAGAALIVSIVRRGRPSALGVAGWGIAAGLAAYLVQLGFSFPLADLDALVWLFAGLLVAPSARRIGLPTGFTRGVVGTAIAAAVAGAVWQGRDVVADRRLRVAVEADARGDTTAADLASWAAGPQRNLARLADRAGETTEARVRYGAVLAIEPGDTEATAWLAAHPA